MDKFLRLGLALLTTVIAAAALHCGPGGEGAQRPGSDASAPGSVQAADVEHRAAIDSAALYLRRGRLYMKERVYSRAISQLRQSVRINPDAPAAHGMLGLAYALRLKPGTAIEHLEQAIALEPENGTHYMHLGKSHMLLTDYAAAKAAYERAITLGLKRGKPYYDLGIISERDNRLDDAHELYQKAIDLVPEFAPQCNLRLGIIAQKQGDDTGAMELYLRALRGDPDLTTAHYRIAQLYLESGHDALAQTHLQQFQQLKAAAGHQGL